MFSSASFQSASFAPVSWAGLASAGAVDLGGAYGTAKTKTKHHVGHGVAILPAVQAFGTGNKKDRPHFVTLPSLALVPYLSVTGTAQHRRRFTGSGLATLPQIDLAASAHHYPDDAGQLLELIATAFDW